MNQDSNGKPYEYQATSNLKSKCDTNSIGPETITITKTTTSTTATTTNTSTSTNNGSNRPRLFEEIRRKNENDDDKEELYPDEVETYIVTIEPKLCKTLLKELASFLPLIKVEELVKMRRSRKDDPFSKEDEDCDDDCFHLIVPLGHLRRVRRRKVECPLPSSTISASESASASASSPNNNICQEPPMKRPKQFSKDEAPNSKSSKKKSTRKSNCNNKNEKPTIHLEVLIGPVKQIDHLLHHNTTNNHKDDDNDINSNTKTATPTVITKGKRLQNMIQKYSLQLMKCKLPGRPAKSQDELNKWKHNWWPTLYFDHQSDSYKEKELELDIDKEEYGIMSIGMMAAIDDAKQYIIESADSNGNGSDSDYSTYGAVIMCPTTEQIISTSFKEMSNLIQESSSSSISSSSTPDNNNSNAHDEEKIRIQQLLHENPLNSPVLYAIQGVSRGERLAAIGLGMNNDSFKNNQYLCTGYDIYLTKEPGIFESMALVHSRIRRVIYCCSSEDGGLGGGGEQTSIHSLPSTNHRYRAFRCIENESSKIYTECVRLTYTGKRVSYLLH